ncbi:MAG: VTT domain-containing protein [Coriobacteriales bacterium]|jgi:uncharacterized membrane protein YdjX (TVP38/TMEM64 family)|nr:VTT domain-containing protein [Coriobacteriales bacterium]
MKPRLSTADKLKFVGLLVFLLLIVLTGVLLMPHFAKLGTDEGRLQLIADINHAGIWGVLICLGLQFVQVVVAFIPGEVVQLAIGAIYGPVAGIFVTALGALISSAFIFFMVRKLGAPFVHAMVSSKHADKLRFFQETKRLDVIVFVLFLIPGLPKDIFTYLVPLTEMRATNFLILSTLGRLPGIAASAFIGDAAVQGNYVGAVVVAVVAGGLGILGIVFNRQIMNLVDRLQRRFGRGRK